MMQHISPQGKRDSRRFDVTLAGDAYLESINAVLIHQGLTVPERLAQLNTIAISQMCSLIGATSVKRLGKPPER